MKTIRRHAASSASWRHDDHIYLQLDHVVRQRRWHNWKACPWSWDVIIKTWLLLGKTNSGCTCWPLRLHEHNTGLDRYLAAPVNGPAAVEVFTCQPHYCSCHNFWKVSLSKNWRATKANDMDKIMLINKWINKLFGGIPARLFLHVSPWSRPSNLGYKIMSQTG